MISNVYKTHDGTVTLVIGLTHAECITMMQKDKVLKLSPTEESDSDAPDVILYSAVDEDALTFEMVKMFGVPGDDVEPPDPTATKENGE